MINLSACYLTKVSNGFLSRGHSLFDNESQYFTTWTIFSHAWVHRAATGSSSTHWVLQKCKGKRSRPVSLIKVSLFAGDLSNIFHIAYKTLLISQSVSISPVCRALYNTGHNYQCWSTWKTHSIVCNWNEAWVHPS